MSPIPSWNWALIAWDYRLTVFGSRLECFTTANSSVRPPNRRRARTYYGRNTVRSRTALAVLKDFWVNQYLVNLKAGSEGRSGDVYPGRMRMPRGCMTWGSNVFFVPTASACRHEQICNGGVDIRKIPLEIMTLLQSKESAGPPLLDVYPVVVLAIGFESLSDIV